MGKRNSKIIIMTAAAIVSMTACFLRWRNESVRVTETEVTGELRQEEINESVSHGTPSSQSGNEGLLGIELDDALLPVNEIKENAQVITETEKKRTEWKNRFPNATVICFRIDFHDDTDHIYYATNGMPVNVWLKSEYNVDNWKYENGYMTDPLGTRYIVCDNDIQYWQLREGDEFDTEIYIAITERTNESENLCGIAMEKFIDEFEEGVCLEEGNIVVREKQQELGIASETVYFYENDAIEEVVKKVYCIDSGLTSCEQLLKTTGEFAEIRRNGNVFECVYPDEYVAEFGEYSKSTVRKILIDQFDFKKNY